MATLPPEAPRTSDRAPAPDAPAAHGDRTGAGRVLAWGGVLGPLAFTGAWLVGGVLVDGYRPAEEAISRLAVAGSPGRRVVTGGMVAFGAGMAAYGQALRGALPGRSWWAATGTGIATLAVAAVPLGASTGRDRLHAAAAGASYATLAAIPLLAARPLAARPLAARPRRPRPAGARSPAPDRRRRAAAVSVGAGGLCAGALAASVATGTPGAWQRAGLGIGHAWVLASAAWMRSSGAPTHGESSRSAAENAID